VANDEDGRRDASGSGGSSGERAAPDPWNDLVIPDDIRGLWRDVAAYRREVRRAARARALHRLLSRRGVVPAISLAAAVLVASVVAVMLTVLNPSPSQPPPAAAKLATPAAKPGALGGLLPGGTLLGQDGTPIDTHSPALRPEVFALVGADCACGQLLNSLAGIAHSENLRLGIVVPTRPEDDVAGRIINSLDRGLPSVFFDPRATLATSVAASGVTAVLVDRDGTIYAVQRDITDPTKTSLEAQLQSMLLADRH
jgi:hypothetical protein